MLTRNDPLSQGGLSRLRDKLHSLHVRFKPGHFDTRITFEMHLFIEYCTLLIYESYFILFFAISYCYKWTLILRDKLHYLHVRFKPADIDTQITFYMFSLMPITLSLSTSIISFNFYVISYCYKLTLILRDKLNLLCFKFKHGLFDTRITFEMYFFIPYHTLLIYESYFISLFTISYCYKWTLILRDKLHYLHVSFKTGDTDKQITFYVYFFLFHYTILIYKSYSIFFFILQFPIVVNELLANDMLRPLYFFQHFYSIVKSFVLQKYIFVPVQGSTDK